MKIAYVDGFKIRQTLDTDFNVIHEHEDDPTQYSPKFYIPRGEVWIDHRYKKEAKYLLKIELDWFGAKSGSYHEARKRAIERVRALGRPPAFIKKTTRQKGLNIRYVDGAIIRKYLDPQFYCGGHELVYEYVPINEIWIDVAMDPRDWPHILLHEITERGLMAKGMAYDPAHEFATATERLSRRDCGGIYPGEPGYPRGLKHADFLKKYVKSYSK